MSAPRKQCDRCNKLYRGHGDWNAVLRHGDVVGFVCTSCQSADENVEAVINEATIDYSRDLQGRVTGRAKR